MNPQSPEDANILEAFTPEGPRNPLRVYIETYGCQMNVNDSEVVASILIDHQYCITNDLEKADIILVNTCSVRENAETRVLGRLDLFAHLKRSKPHLIVGVIGCMAVRMNSLLLQRKNGADLVVGPDSYRRLPHLLQSAQKGIKNADVTLSQCETYADINPVRLSQNQVSAFVSIMRGCNNVCSYCVVPYTRGPERSRDPQSIVNEVDSLSKAGYKEVTLLGQNVNSYRWLPDKDDPKQVVNFADLLEMVAQVDPRMRIRFATSHPKDINRDVIYTMAMYENICNHIHLPFQSGSDRLLKLMNRHYTRAGYINRIETIREILPDCAITTDIIAGFCTETEIDHDQTLSLMREVGFDLAYMFKYSERPNTKAARHLADDVPDEIKTRRLNEIIQLQQQLSQESKQRDVGKRFEVLIEGVSKKDPQQLFGRTSMNKVVVFPKMDCKIGDFVFVEITSCTPATLIGHVVEE